MIFDWSMIVLALAIWAWLALNLWLHASHLGGILGKKADAMITGKEGE
jgi:hypothetical protein